MGILPSLSVRRAKTFTDYPSRACSLLKLSNASIILNNNNNNCNNNDDDDDDNRNAYI